MKITKEQNRALCGKYPFLIPRNRWTDKIPDGYDYGFTELDMMPDGWRIAFGEQLCSELKEELEKAGALDGYRIMQIKEKYGGLRWYDNRNTKRGHEIVSKYEEMSLRTCVQCGAPATRMALGWICPYCDACCPDEPSIPIEEWFSETKEESE